MARPVDLAWPAGGVLEALGARVLFDRLGTWADFVAALPDDLLRHASSREEVELDARESAASRGCGRRLAGPHAAIGATLGNRM